MDETTQLIFLSIYGFFITLVFICCILSNGRPYESIEDN